MNEIHDLKRQPTIDPHPYDMPPAERAAYANGFGQGERKSADEITRLRAALAETHKRVYEYRDESLALRKMYGPCIELKAVLAAAERAAYAAECDRLAADFAAAREVLKFYAQHHAWFNAIIPNDQGAKARAFLERTATQPVVPPPDQSKAAGSP